MNARRVLPSSVIIALGASIALAQQTSVRPGINESYRHPDVRAAIKRFEGAGREIVQKQKEILAACQLKPGMDVADIGAGTGLFTRSMARQVGTKGKVYAVDITKEFLDHIADTCRRQGIDNVETVLGTAASTELKPRSIDLAFISDTYHHFEFPQKTLASIHQALRPGGRLVIVEFKKGEGPDSRMDNHVRADRKTVIQEITDAGFTLLDQPDLMKTQYVLRFEVRGARDEG